MDLVDGRASSVTRRRVRPLPGRPDGRFILSGDTILGATTARRPSRSSPAGDWAWSPDLGSARPARVAPTETRTRPWREVTSWPGTGPCSITSRSRDVRATRRNGPTSEGSRLARRRQDRRERLALPPLRRLGVLTGLRTSRRVDPDARSGDAAAVLGGGGSWSPDGGRVLFPDGGLYLANGTSLGPLLRRRRDRVPPVERRLLLEVGCTTLRAPARSAEASPPTRSSISSAREPGDPARRGAPAGQQRPRRSGAPPPTATSSASSSTTPARPTPRPGTRSAPPSTCRSSTTSSPSGCRRAREPTSSA